MIRLSILLIATLLCVCPPVWSDVDLVVIPVETEIDVQGLEETTRRIVERTSSQLGLAPPARLELLVARAVPETPSEREALGVGNVPKWAAGLAQARRGRIVLFLDNIGSYPHADLSGLLAHEVCHWLLGANLRPGREVPRWYDEGLAMTCERQASFDDAWRLAREAILARSIALEEITYAWPRQHGRARAAYAQSLSVVSLAEDSARPQAPGRLVSRMNAGASFDSAFQDAYGIPVYVLEARWKARLRQRYVLIPVIALVAFTNGLMGFLALWGYRAVRARRRRRLEQMEEEETRFEREDRLNWN